MARQRVEPGPGQESVWDYPRPPRMEDVDKKVKVVFGGVTVAYTTRAKRVLETSHPPVYYVPPEDIRMEHLESSDATSYCEWKGRARYYDLVTDERTERQAAWCYPEPVRSFAEPQGLRGVLSVDGWMVAGSVERRSKRRRGISTVVGSRRRSLGPFKGAPGTWGW